MPSLSTLMKMISPGEGSLIEFKRKVRHPEKIVREVVAFANSEGGSLFIGVDDNGVPLGVKFPDEEDYELRKAIAELCRPKIQFSSEKFKLADERWVLHYKIDKGNEGPYYAFLKKEHRRGRAFVRVDDKSVQASRELRQVIKRSRSEEGRTISYGESEHELMKYLDVHGKGTLNEFVKHSGKPLQTISEMLINLTVSNVLKLIPTDSGDQFIFVENFQK